MNLPLPYTAQSQKQTYITEADSVGSTNPLPKNQVFVVPLTGK